MGGKAIRSEPSKLVVSEVARGILERAGWLNYFNRLQESNEAVAMEFLRNLEEEHSMVGGNRIVVTEEVIAEVTGLPAVGPVWTKKKERLQRIIEVFQDEGQNLTVKGKGVLPATLGEPWSELAKVVQSYITCEGRKDVVRPRHLKLLAVLKRKCSVNLPALLNTLLHDASQNLKKAQHEDAVVSHHGLIRLIVSHNLAQQQSGWAELITIIGGGSVPPSPKDKHPASTSEQPRKRREPSESEHPSDTPEQPEKRTEKRKRSSRTPRQVEKHKKLATEERVTSKRRHSATTPEQPEKHRRMVVEEQVASTPEQPERPRKSALLAKIRGRLEKFRLNIEQPIEIADEPSIPEEEPSRENNEQIKNEADPIEEEAEEGNEQSDSETEVGHSEAATEQPIQEEEVEQLGDSPQRDPIGEDELAAILANLGDYGLPSSPIAPPEKPSEEETNNELHEEIVGEDNPPAFEEDSVNTNREQSVPMIPEENPPVVDKENIDASQERPVPEITEETFDGQGTELKATQKPPAEAKEIKKLKKKQRKLLSTIAQLRQKIRSLQASLRMRRTTGRRKRTNIARSHRRGRQRAARRPVDLHDGDRPEIVPASTRNQSVVPSEMGQQNTGPNDAEEQTAVPNSPVEPAAVPIKTEPQDDIPFAEGPPHPFVRVKIEKENRAVQTELPPLGIIRDRNSRQQSVKIQVKLPASEKLWKKDPKTKALRHKMKQARQEADQLRE